MFNHYAVRPVGSDRFFDHLKDVHENDRSHRKILKLTKETPKKERDDYNGCTGEDLRDACEDPNLDYLDIWEKDTKNQPAP